MSVYVGERDVVSAEGPETVGYLQGQLSQDVERLAPGESAWSFILQPQGKVDAWFRITRTGDESFLLDVDSGWGETLLARLQRFKLRTKCDLALHTWTWHAYRGEPAGDIDAPIFADVNWNGVGTDIVGPDLADPSGDPLDEETFTRLRILAGVPAMGAELDESTIPAEAGVVDHSVSFTKGCYTGQELVARVDSRGNNTPRKLRLVRSAGPVPAVDTFETVLGDAGRVTSAAPDADGWVALAYVKRAVEVPAVVGANDEISITALGDA
jgi:folate-binding protein YgfZ